MQGDSSKKRKASTTGIEHIILQKRDLTLLENLSVLRIADRNQVSKICGFSSTTRVNSRLLKLTNAALINRFFFVSELGGKKAIYTLSKKGAELIGKTPNGLSRPHDSFLIGDRFINHQLAVNEVYCAAHEDENIYIEGKRLGDWRSFKHPLSKLTPIIPDAYFEIHSKGGVQPVFLEVDLGTESLAIWEKKTTNYINLAATGEFERIFGHPRFSVAAVFATERRMHSLRAHVNKITSKLLYFTTLEEIEKHGIFAPIWFRPEGNQLQSLI